jgi:predicted porin
MNKKYKSTKLPSARTVLGYASAIGVAVILGTSCTLAADLTTVKGDGAIPAIPLPPPSCTDVGGFFLTDCQLSMYGIRIYGAVDTGAAYQTKGAPFDPNFVTGASYFIQKMNRESMFGAAPNGQQQSNIGFKGSLPMVPGVVNFIFDVNAGFDPESLRLADSPKSEVNNIGVPVNQQSTNGDSSRAGQWYNGNGFVGLSSPTYGTVTVFRQNNLTNDALDVYDPMITSYAFSPIHFSGVVGGGGDTENAKFSSAVKYRLSYLNFRVAGLVQFGGYDLNNGSTGAYEGQVGGDFHIGPGKLSVDAIGGYNRNAVNLGLSGAPTNAAGYPIGTELPQTLTATVSDNTNVMGVAKYETGPVRLYSGYEWMQFAPPSNPQTNFSDIQGFSICPTCGNGSAINNTAYSSSAGFNDKILQAFWVGARYAVAPFNVGDVIVKDVEVAIAYYHYDQNNFTASAANQAKCAVSNTNASQCHGTMDAVSTMVDWKFAAKWDAYIGTMYSGMNGGLANGYLARDNIATTGGIRFRF